jgi:adenosylmethionine---8-amino-7-oxononanoate aminotransferase
VENVQQLEGWLRRGLAPLASHRAVGDIRVIGGVGIVELVTDKTTKAAGGYLDSVAPDLTKAFLARGLLLRPLGNVVYAMPPYVITEDETAWLTTNIADAIDEVLGA